MVLASKGLSLEEFLQLPEEKPALEYIDGVVSQKVSPKARHGMLQFRLAERINAVAEPARTALALPEVRTTCGGASYVPDVSVYRWARVPLDKDGDIVDDLLEPPDIAIEILSPGQSVRTLVQRCERYVAYGVHIALLVDPKRRSVLTFRGEGVAEERKGTDSIDIAAVVPGFELTVDELFASLRIGRDSGA